MSGDTKPGIYPKQVVIRNEETKQYDSGERGRSHPALANPCGHKSRAERRGGSQSEPGELHCKGKIEGGFGLVVVWPQARSARFSTVATKIQVTKAAMTAPTVLKVA